MIDFFVVREEGGRYRMGGLSAAQSKRGGRRWFDLGAEGMTIMIISVDMLRM